MVELVCACKRTVLCRAASRNKMAYLNLEQRQRML